MKTYLELWETPPRGAEAPDMTGAPRRNEYVPIELITRTSYIVAHHLLRGENEDEYLELMEKNARWRRARREFLATLERPGELEFSDSEVKKFTPHGGEGQLMVKHQRLEALDLSRQDAERLIRERNTWRLVMPGWTETTELQRREVTDAVSRWLLDAEVSKKAGQRSQRGGEQCRRR